MKPRNGSQEKVESEEATIGDGSIDVKSSAIPKIQIKWLNVTLMSLAHVGALTGLYMCLGMQVKYQTLICAYVMWLLSGIGITGGAHRLWAHRSYKAKLPLRILLAIMQSHAYQNSIYDWSRDHRVHHKYSETNADPHNANRGFFFSHVGWLLSKKHPDVIEKGRQIDLSDLRDDPVVMLQHRYYTLSIAIFCFALPALIPWYFWGESLYRAFYVCSLLRWVLSLHSIWFVNSWAHMYGRRPYDKNIGPSENRFVSWIASGEGFHNYHHVFAWDYAASELGFDLNWTKLFIDFFALFGLAYDRRVVSPEMIKQRKDRTGDVDVFGPYGPYNPVN